LVPALACPSLACLARPQRQIQPTLVSSLGVVAPPASGPLGASGCASGVSGRGSVVSGRGSGRGSGASGRGVSGRGVSGRGVSGRGSGVPSRGAVPTRAPGWRGAQVRIGKSPRPFLGLFNVQMLISTRKKCLGVSPLSGRTFTGYCQRPSDSSRIICGGGR